MCEPKKYLTQSRLIRGMDQRRVSMRQPAILGIPLPVLVLCLLWPSMGLHASCPPAEQRGTPADRLYVNGIVLSMDDTIGTASAVAVRSGRIAAVGNDDAVACLQGPDTQVTDLTGRTLLPGFIDSHSHLAYVGIYKEHAVPLYGPPIGTVNSIDGLLAALGERAAATPDGEWVYGVGYDDTTLHEGRHPTRHDLDRISTRHPIWIYHMSFHFAAVNTLGLTRLSITVDTADPTGGIVHRDPGTRMPNGVLEEGPALQLGFGYDLPITDREAVDSIRAATALYASRGFTTAQSGQASVRQLELMQRAYTIGPTAIGPSDGVHGSPRHGGTVGGSAQARSGSGPGHAAHRSREAVRRWCDPGLHRLPSRPLPPTSWG